jgi:recombination protein RecT
MPTKTEEPKTQPEQQSLTPVEQQQSPPTKKPKPIRDLLTSDHFKSAVQAALPQHMKVERFVRVALTATLRQPELLQCTQESFFKAMLDLSMYGVEPDGRRAHLIPFNCKIKYKDENGVQRERWEKQVQLILDYKGIAELVRRSGDVSYIHADVVYPNDDWDFAYGTNAFLKHKPCLERHPSHKLIAAYSFVKLKDGTEDFVVLGPSEIEKVRKRSKAADSGPWVTDYDEMAKKTAFRRHSKWLPLSPETKEAVERDDEFTGIDVSAMDSLPEVPPSITLDQVKASSDANRGHDEVVPETVGS